MHRHTSSAVVAIHLLLGALPAGAQCSADAKNKIAAHQFETVKSQLTAQLARRKDDAAAMNCLGRIALEQDESAKAVESLEKAASTDPKNAQHHLWLGLALRVEGGKAGMMSAASFISRMKAELEQALAIDPGLVEARYALLLFYAQAPAMVGGDVGKAREQATEIAKSNPMRGHLGNGYIAEIAKDLAVAEKEFLGAIATRPDSDVVYGATAAFYRRRERWADAATMSEKQLKLLPRDTWPTKAAAVRYALGQSYEKLGRRNDAIAQYEAALTANPNAPDAKKALAALKGG